MAGMVVQTIPEINSRPLSTKPILEVTQVIEIDEKRKNCLLNEDLLPTNKLYFDKHYLR